MSQHLHSPMSRRALLMASATVVGAVAGAVVCPSVLSAEVGASPATGLDPVVERRIDALMAQMTLEEKVSLLSGANRFSTAAIPRLGIPSLRMADGPNGVRTDDTSSATVFPASVALAATWNPALAREVGRAIGEEAIAKDYQIVLGPAMNIQRVPLGGRNFEYFSEDPVLTGEMAVGWTLGVRSTGRLTTPKHFAANNQEHERKRMNADVSERALREIYLPAFHEVITRADPVMVMTAYNKVNGTFASENAWLLHKVLKGEWAFEGAVMSDFGAVHSTAPAVNGGLDLEMPGPPLELGPKLVEAVRRGEVSMPALDGAVRRMVRAVIRSGTMDASAPARAGSLDTPEHRAVARKAATEAITLLRNENGALPLDTSGLKSLAVIGPNADARVIQGGGSSEVNPIRAVTPLEGLRAALPSSVHIRVAEGVDNNRYPPAADPRYFSPTRSRNRQGLVTRYWASGGFVGNPAKRFADDVFMRFRFGDEVTDKPSDRLAVRSDGYFWPPRDGEYVFQLLDLGSATLTLDGQPLITPETPAGPPPLFDMLGWKAREARVTLNAGQACRFRLEMLPAHGMPPAYRIGIRMPGASIEDAVAAARDADAAVVFVGSSNTSESETSDRESLDLFGRQNALVEAVAAANPRTIVVLNSGGPLALPWTEKVPAIIAAWFLGGETGLAIADVLLGHANPSGKLPMTFPRRLADNPTYPYYPGGLEVKYGEDILVGYRWYDAKGIDPLFPFGHGLSYTSFAFEGLRIEPAGQGWAVQVDVTNSGARAGAEVVQLYLGMPEAAGEPPLQLKRFAKVLLQPGERRTVSFGLSARDLSHWNVERGNWAMTPGRYAIAIGRSSRDIVLRSEFMAGEGR